MKFDEYQAQARRTQNPELNDGERMMHALHGLASEVGEIHGIFQKAYQGHPTDATAVVDELGDLMWFAAELCDVLGISLEAVARGNVEKLIERYPAGFQAERSLNR